MASGLSRSLPCFGVDNRGVSPALAALRINRAGAEPELRHLRGGRLLFMLLEMPEA